MEKEEKQIRDLWFKACENLCDGDWEGYADCWFHSPQIQLIHPDQGEWLKGWEEISAKYLEMLNSGITCNIPRNVLNINISSSAEMAWGTVDLQINFSDVDKTQLHLWETVVFEKVNGKWKIIHGMAAIPKI